MARKTWIQDPETGKLIPKEEYYRRSSGDATYIQRDVESFVSPIDGSVIHSRRQLRDHNIKHGVTDMREYGPDWFERKARERASRLSGKADKAARVDEIRRSMYRHGVLE